MRAKRLDDETRCHGGQAWSTTPRRHRILHDKIAVKPKLPVS